MCRIVIIALFFRILFLLKSVTKIITENTLQYVALKNDYFKDRFARHPNENPNENQKNMDNTLC